MGTNLADRLKPWRDLDAPLEGVPTRVHRPLVDSGDQTLYLVADDDARPVGDVVDELNEALPVSNHRGWGPAMPIEEEKRTTMWEREALLKRSSRYAPPDEEDLDEEEKPTVIVELSPEERAAILRGPVKKEEEATKPPATEPRRGWLRQRPVIAIVAALCGVAGVITGVSVGYALTQDGARADALPEAPAREPVPAEATEAVAATEPEPAAEAVEDEAVAEATAPAEQAPEEPAEEPAVSPAELVEEANVAIEDFDVERAQELLVRARGAGADEVATARVEARLAVVRGDGELAVQRLRTLSRQHRDAVIFVALGRTLVFAEQDPAAQDAFETALELDPNDVDAHLGLVHINARAAEVPAAQQHLNHARSAFRRLSEPSTRLSARLHVAEGAVEFERGHHSSASREAEEALTIDHHSAEAAALLARVAYARSNSTLPHLRMAVDGRAPPPFALGMLAGATRGEEACDLAERYLDRAPHGFDASAMNRINRRCSH